MANVSFHLEFDSPTVHTIWRTRKVTLSDGVKQSMKCTSFIMDHGNSDGPKSQSRTPQRIKFTAHVMDRAFKSNVFLHEPRLRVQQQSYQSEINFSCFSFVCGKPPRMRHLVRQFANECSSRRLVRLKLITLLEQRQASEETSECSRVVRYQLLLPPCTPRQ